jgi:ring-1,2-phenylacetyl-CoA epoxidase subunit PaaA/ring-1,2-phenylacetyl-CoA epoxidase subunit PaaC
VSALADVLHRLAAAKHALGYRLAFAGLSAPALEAAVATVAIAQEELGHARLLYAAELRLRGGAGEDEGAVGAAIGTAPPAPDLVPAPGTWAEVLATLATLDTALSLWLGRLADSGEAWLRPRAQRMLDEEAFHRDYLGAWLEVAAATPALAAGVATAAEAALGRYGSWLDALAPGAAAAGVAVPPSGADLAAAVGELVTRRQHAGSVP